MAQLVNGLISAVPVPLVHEPLVICYSSSTFRVQTASSLVAMTLKKRTAVQITLFSLLYQI